MSKYHHTISCFRVSLNRATKREKRHITYRTFSAKIVLSPFIRNLKLRNVRKYKICTRRGWILGFLEEGGYYLSILPKMFTILTTRVEYAKWVKLIHNNAPTFLKKTKKRKEKKTLFLNFHILVPNLTLYITIITDLPQDHTN